MSVTLDEATYNSPDLSVLLSYEDDPPQDRHHSTVQELNTEMPLPNFVPSRDEVESFPDTALFNCVNPESRGALRSILEGDENECDNPQPGDGEQNEGGNGVDEELRSESEEYSIDN